jgi:hypothetical protein
MAPADRGIFEALRDSYRFRYREPCLLPGHKVIALWGRTLSREWVKDCHRTTLRFMRRVDTAFEV